MALATVSADGAVSARIVLLRGLDERGLTFFTNRESRKGIELRERSRAAAVLHWWELGRQARIEGDVVEVSREESDAYWRSRPRASRIAGAVSPQSQPLESRAQLDRLFADAEASYGAGEVPLPDHWSGFRIVPDAIEFWTHRDDRLHDRILFTHSLDGWTRQRLAP
jgi:pyridoxamine 5'-phosphate oxidase